MTRLAVAARIGPIAAPAAVAWFRIGRSVPPALRICPAGLPLAGRLSVPASYLVLEKLKWELLPQVQPMRAALFAMAMAQFSAAAAAIVAAQSRYVEALAWFAVGYPIAMHVQAGGLPTWRQALVLWAACGADNKQRTPGIFRAEAQPALYAACKDGRQINYLSEFANQRWRRWLATAGNPHAPTNAEPYGKLGIDYLAGLPAHQITGCQPVFENASYRGCAI